MVSNSMKANTNNKLIVLPHLTTSHLHLVEMDPSLLQLDDQDQESHCFSKFMEC